MTKLGLVMWLVVVAVGCTDADAQSAGGCSGCMQHVGYTSQAVPAYRNGFGGVFHHYSVCQAEFGAGHRSCTVDEILGTTSLAPPFSESDPEPAHAWANTGASGCFAGALSAESVGTTVTSRGRFESRGCGEELPIACCGPR
jgi:hypothetical protein